VKSYVPQVDDSVFVLGRGFVRYKVAGVDANKKKADIVTTAGLLVLTRDVPWKQLLFGGRSFK
jgi:hypothetical protein